MSKVSPIMKHAKPKLTPEQAAVEDFMNSIPPSQMVEGDAIIDNTLTEILAQPENSLDPIIDSEVAADNLEELATDIDGITQAPALESFKRIFSHMTQMSGHPATFGLEEFKATKGGVRKFAKAVRSHATLIRECVTLGLEDYVDRVDESVGSSLANLKQVMGELAQVQSNLAVPEGKIEINHKAVWNLFHINDELIDLRDFSSEINGVKELAHLVSQGKDAVLKAVAGEVSGSALGGKTFVQLMQNLDVTVKDGRAHFDHQPVKPPGKEWSGMDWFWVFIFSFAGLAYRLIKGGSADQAKKEQCLKAIHRAIEEAKKLGPIVDGIDKDVKAITSAIDKVEGDKQTALKKFASPVLEVADQTTKHVTAVCHGLMKVFSQLD